MYRIFGYTDDLEHFDFTLDSFVHAVKKYRELNNSLCVACFCRNGEIASCKFVR